LKQAGSLRLHSLVTAKAAAFPLPGGQPATQGFQPGLGLAIAHRHSQCGQPLEVVEAALEVVEGALEGVVEVRGERLQWHCYPHHFVGRCGA